MVACTPENNPVFALRDYSQLQTKESVMTESKCCTTTLNAQCSCAYLQLNNMVLPLQINNMVQAYPD